MTAINRCGAVALCTAFLLSCAAQQDEPKVASSPETPKPSPSQPEPEAATEPSSLIYVSREVQEACEDFDIPTPEFDYDSARVRRGDRQDLRGLVECFQKGPLKGEGMLLVGHADPRGGAEYNFLLGGRRAHNVKELFVHAGLDANRIETSSRGELDARGTNEETWQRDRRVDVRVVD